MDLRGDAGIPPVLGIYRGKKSHEGGDYLMPSLISLSGLRNRLKKRRNPLDGKGLTCLSRRAAQRLAAEIALLGKKTDLLLPQAVRSAT